MISAPIGYLCIAATLLLTVYGQLIVRWQVGRAGTFPIAFSDRMSFLAHLVVNPWVLSALAAAFIAALSWMTALTRFDLSHAYPFMSLSFVLVLFASGLLFDESITPTKIVGVGLLVVGLVVGSR